MIYFDEHRQEFVSRYPEHWVAIYHKQVVAAARELGELIAQMDQNGIPPGQAYAEYASDDELTLILAVTSR